METKPLYTTRYETEPVHGELEQWIRVMTHNNTTPQPIPSPISSMVCSVVWRGARNGLWLTMRGGDNERQEDERRFSDERRRVVGRIRIGSSGELRSHVIRTYTRSISVRSRSRSILATPLPSSQSFHSENKLCLDRQSY